MPWQDHISLCLSESRGSTDEGESPSRIWLASFIPLITIEHLFFFGHYSQDYGWSREQKLPGASVAYSVGVRADSKKQKRLYDNLWSGPDMLDVILRFLVLSRVPGALPVTHWSSNSQVCFSIPCRTWVLCPAQSFWCSGCGVEPETVLLTGSQGCWCWSGHSWGKLWSTLSLEKHQRGWWDEVDLWAQMSCKKVKEGKTKTQETAATQRDMDKVWLSSSDMQPLCRSSCAWKFPPKRDPKWFGIEFTFCKIPNNNGLTEYPQLC